LTKGGGGRAKTWGRDKLSKVGPREIRIGVQTVSYFALEIDPQMGPPEEGLRGRSRNLRVGDGGTVGDC